MLEMNETLIQTKLGRDNLLKWLDASDDSAPRTRLNTKFKTTMYVQYCLHCNLSDNNYYVGESKLTRFLRNLLSFQQETNLCLHLKMTMTRLTDKKHRLMLIVTRTII